MVSSAGVGLPVVRREKGKELVIRPRLWNGSMQDLILRRGQWEEDDYCLDVPRSREVAEVLNLVHACMDDILPQSLGDAGTERGRSSPGWLGRVTGPQAYVPSLSGGRGT